MGDFGEILGCDSMATLNFFYQYLREEAGGRKALAVEETVYTASVLAHYTQVTRAAGEGFPAPATLSDVFNNFVGILYPAFLAEDREALPANPEIMEAAGSQTLLMAGFFRDQMRRRHAVHWYDDLGGEFYNKVAAKTSDQRKAALMQRMSIHFPVWAEVCCKVSRTLRDQPYLLRFSERPPAA